jgi:two-component system cell cycle sensor histidine kinase/response regulator CckA
MNDSSATPARKGRRFDPLIVAGAAFFVLAIGAAAYPALRVGPATLGGMVLLGGLAAVCFLGLFAFVRADTQGEPGLDAAMLVQAMAEPSAVVSSDGRLTAMNPAWRETLGTSRRLPRGSAGGLFAALASARRGQPASGDLTVRGATHGVCAAPLGGELILLRLPPPPPAQAAPRTGERAAAALDPFAAAAPFGAAILDGEDPFTAPIVLFNPALEAMAARKDLAGSTLGDLIEAASRADADQRLAAGRGPVELRLHADPQRIVQLYLSHADGRLLAYLVDVSEQKQLELQLSQSQKMQAIGQLAGGVAHDFNNLLTAIQLRLDELLHRHPVGDPSYEGLTEIRQTGARAADLVRKLLAFSRKQTVQRETLDLGELISEFEVLLRRLLREDVKLKTDYGRNLPLVRADKAQLETAVMNLAVNARDAMKAQGGGVVCIRTARVSRAEARALGYPAADGECALIEVADTGPGIPAEVRDKIWEPFFTTKPVGEGTGLGLATVYGIVKQADGWIHVESRPGEGAAFRIFLPVFHPPANAEIVPVAVKAKPVARDLSGAGRILFVEDEDAVRGVAARLLRARGYEVIEAADGEAALELAETHAGKIDLLISDVIMPGMDGPTLLKKARVYLGSAPVMFISGYAEAEFSDLLEGEDGVTFLAKPIDIKSLAERVKQQLQAAA